MSEIAFKQKFVAFIDIIGFESLVEAAELGNGKSLPDLLKILGYLGDTSDIAEYAKYGPLVCPLASRINQHLDFKISQVSDCAIITSEVSAAGIINLISHCWTAVYRLLSEGIMCRGYITKGNIYHTNSQFIGTAYQHAVRKEKTVSVFKKEIDETGTPFVEIDSLVHDYISLCSDKCVTEMFERMTMSDGMLRAIFPFKSISHNFIISSSGSSIDYLNNKSAISKLRERLRGYIKLVTSFIDTNNPSAVSKAQHYILALEKQIEVCNQTEEMLEMLITPYPSRKLKDVVSTIVVIPSQSAKGNQDE